MHIKRLLKYILVGLGTNGLLYAASLVLVFLGISAPGAMAMVFPVGVLISFLFNRNWTFQMAGQKKSFFARYALIYGLVFILSPGGVYILELGGASSAVALFLMTGLNAVVLFILLNVWVFRPASKEMPEKPG